MTLRQVNWLLNKHDYDYSNFIQSTFGDIYYLDGENRWLDMIRENIAKMKDFPEDLSQKLEHIILAHQGRFEWQSPREPLFLEALMVYYIDEIDTRINQMKKAIESDTSGEKWTNKSNYFRRPLYKEKNN